MTTTAGELRLGACLSLTGAHARFGRQARVGLEAWKAFDETADLVIEDDHSDPDILEAALRHLSSECDLLLGPYSTRLTRRAGRVAAELDRLIWNHGGSGDDVQAAHPGHLLSVPTPTSRYADPFLHHLAGIPKTPRLRIVQGKGSFGRQVADGAEAMAHELGLEAVRAGPGEELLPEDAASEWSLLCAGSFEEDVETVTRARDLPHPPHTVCAVAAGVREFGQAVENPKGIYGVGQWFPGSGGQAALGPTESEFLTAYEERAGAPPDYPAVQAASAAAIAAHCARTADSTARNALWAAASALDTTTLFGRFRIDPSSGVQMGHEPALVRWNAHEPAAFQEVDRPPP